MPQLLLTWFEEVQSAIFFRHCIPIVLENTFGPSFDLISLFVGVFRVFFVLHLSLWNFDSGESWHGCECLESAELR